jgi:hypothetical protein
MKTDDFGRAREYAAWMLLAAAAVQVALGARTLAGLPGGPGSSAAAVFRPATAPAFAFRAESAIPELVAVTVTALPVTAVLLVALAGRAAATARQIVLTAVTIQAVALALGLVAWLGSIGTTGWFYSASVAAEIAVAAAGLILTNTVQRARVPARPRG